MYEKNKIDGSKLVVTSGYGHATRKPFVMIESDKLDSPWQMSPEDARNVAMMLLEVAEAAETDKFIFDFMVQSEASEEIAGRLLLVFREYRDKSRKEGERRQGFGNKGG